MTNFIKKYFSFDGRASRKEFFIFFASFHTLSIAMQILEREYEEIIYEQLWLLILPFLIFLAAFIVATIASTVRRLHDINYQGWWFLFTLILPFGFILPAILLFIKGTKGPNRYGPDPLDKTNESEILSGGAIKY